VEADDPWDVLRQAGSARQPLNVDATIQPRLALTLTTA